MSWEIVAIVMALAGPLEFTSDELKFETKRACEDSIVQATRDFVEAARHHDVVANHRFVVLCREIGEPA